MTIHEPHAPSSTTASTNTVQSISPMRVEVAWRWRPVVGLGVLQLKTAEKRTSDNLNQSQMINPSIRISRKTQK